MKILDFKTVSPLFEIERDGIKPFTIRHIEMGDKRQRALSQWQPHSRWAARITNPATGESFTKAIVAVDFLRYYSSFKLTRFEDWRVIVLGES